MNILNCKKLFYLICVFIFLSAIVTNAAENDNQKDPNEIKVEIPKLSPMTQMIQRARAAGEDRRAEKRYAKRNAEIVPFVEDSPPLNPDNAALLYYQAFLLWPEPNDSVFYKMNMIRGGEVADREVRTYMGHCLPMINLAEIASRIPQCTWGIRNSPEPEFGMIDLRSNVFHLTDILGVDARILAYDGHYRAALDRCLTMCRLSNHLSGNSELCIVSLKPEFSAMRAAQYILGVMPPDVETLTWFRGQLTNMQDVQTNYNSMLQNDFKSTLSYMQSDPNLLAKLKSQLLEKAEGEQAKAFARNLTDDQIIDHACEIYTAYLNSIFQVLDSDMLYEQKYAQMKSLTDKFREKYINDPVIAIVIKGSSMDVMINRIYPNRIGHLALTNGIKAAVEVYLVLAKTGKLPEKLPDNLPKDPFTGQDFVYEITDEGFALCCQDEEFLRRKNQFLEFKVQK
jgi:hypothetical protein